MLTGGWPVTYQAEIAGRALAFAGAFLF